MTVEGFTRYGAESVSDPGGPAAALVALRDLENRLVLQLRDDRPTVANAGFWGFFGGGVEPGESLLEAAQRELREETGVIAPPDRLTPFGWTQSATSKRTRLFVYDLQLDVSPQDIRLTEGAGFGFFTADQARSLAVVPVLILLLHSYLTDVIA